MVKAPPNVCARSSSVPPVLVRLVGWKAYISTSSVSMHPSKVPANRAEFCEPGAVGSSAPKLDTAPAPAPLWTDAVGAVVSKGAGSWSPRSARLPTLVSPSWNQTCDHEDGDESGDCAHVGLLSMGCRRPCRGRVPSAASLTRMGTTARSGRLAARQGRARRVNGRWLLVLLLLVLQACGQDPAPGKTASVGTAPRPLSVPTTAPASPAPLPLDLPPTQAPSAPEDLPVIEIPVRFETAVDTATAEGFATFVAGVLTDPRGWEQAGFRFVFRDDAPYTILLAEPAQVDAACQPYDVGGRFSCQIGPLVALNADRWRSATETWPLDLLAYRTMLVNHEVGHLLGRHHVRPKCGAAGGTAAVMAQQSSGLDGCQANPWPLPWEIDCAARHDEPIAPGYEADPSPTCGPPGG